MEKVRASHTVWRGWIAAAIVIETRARFASVSAVKELVIFILMLDGAVL